MGQIGEFIKEIEVVPLPDTVPVTEPVGPVEAPVKEPKVPVSVP